MLVSVYELRWQTRITVKYQCDVALLVEVHACTMSPYVTVHNKLRTRWYEYKGARALLVAAVTGP